MKHVIAIILSLLLITVANASLKQEHVGEHILTIIEQPSPIKYDYKGVYELTWYCEGMRTASGNKVNHNLTAAADVRGGNFKFNDVVYIDYLNKPVIIHDTGSAIKGNKLDIYVNDCNVAKQQGRKTSKVYLIGE